MISNELGQIQDNLYKLGLAECPIFLLDGQTPVVFDAGVTCAGEIYAESIRSVLGGRQPSILFLTHVHWDHCGAVAYLKNAFPDMKVAASNLSLQILKRPNAIELIKKLNAAALTGMVSIPKSKGIKLVQEPFSEFQVDMILEDKQVVDLGNNSWVKVLATPGHTQDHFSYFMPKECILIAGEAAGVYYDGGVVSTEFVSSYQAYVDSLERLICLPTDICCPGHYQHMIGREEVNLFFRRSIAETIRFKNRVLAVLDDEDGSQDRAVQRLKKEWYDPIQGPKQPEPAYILNLKARVAHLASNR